MRYTMLLAGCMLITPGVSAQVPVIPQRVMQTLEARFPGAAIQKWTREREGDVVLYDIEFTRQGQKFEADIKEDGTIHNWEREVPAGELPPAVQRTVRTKYPGATITLVMAITAIQDGKEALESYEILLMTADRRDLELAVAPDGRFIEEKPAGS